MSVQAMAWVFDHSTSASGDRLVLLAIANHLGYRNEEQGCWPSKRVIGLEARMSERNVQRCIANLEALGELLVTRQKGSKEGTNLYRLTAFTGYPQEGGDKLSPETNATVGETNPVVRGDAGVSQTGRTVMKGARSPQQEQFDRNARRSSGDACPRCGDTGWFVDEADTSTNPTARECKHEATV